jgi:hypothetical protein
MASSIPVDPSDFKSVPDMIGDTTDLVQDMLSQSQAWANDAIQQANEAMDQLAQASLPADLPDPPPEPIIVTAFNSSVSLGFGTQPDLGSITTRDENLPPLADIVIPDITAEIPEYHQIITGLSIPEAPSFVPPTLPEIPPVDYSFVVPDAPEQAFGPLPALYDLNLPTYVPPVIPVFNDDVPTFSTLPPNPFVDWVEPSYTSDIRDAVKEVLQSMLAGGTGLTPTVERAIWERGRTKVDAAAVKFTSEALSAIASRGFGLPPGVLNAQLIAAYDEALLKTNELARDVAIKQAELEQTNRQFAVQQGLQYEQIFVNVFLQTLDRSFQLAKFAVESQIQIYNSQIALFNVQQAIFAQRTERFKALLEATFVEIKAYAAQVEAEKAKGEINMSRVASYKATVEAFGAQVEAFNGLVKAQIGKAELQKNKVELYKAQIEGNIAEVNSQKAQYDAYGERVRAESAKAQLEEANARAYTARVQGIGVKAEISFKQAEAQIAENRLTLDWTVARLQRLNALTQADLANIQAKAQVYNANTARGTAKHEADTRTLALAVQTQIEASRLAVAKYSALLEQWRTRASQIIAMSGINAESLRSAGQIASNLAAGAMAGTHVSAGISGSAAAGQSAGSSTSNSYSESKSESDSNSYSTSHNYNYEV